MKGTKIVKNIERMDGINAKFNGKEPKSEYERGIYENNERIKNNILRSI